MKSEPNSIGPTNGMNACVSARSVKISVIGGKSTCASTADSRNDHTSRPTKAIHGTPGWKYRSDSRPFMRNGIEIRWRTAWMTVRTTKPTRTTSQPRTTATSRTSPIQ
jgi:hypothetical protein